MSEPVRIGDATLYTGDVRAVLASCSGVIECLRLDVEFFTHGEDFRFHHSLCRATTYTAERVILGFPEPENRPGRFLLDDEKRKDSFEDSTRECVRCLPTEKRSTEGRASLLMVVIPPKVVAEELNRSLVNHSDLNAFVVDWTHTIFAMSSLNPDVSLPVNQSSKIGNRRPFHGRNHTTPRFWWSSKKGALV